MKYGRVPEFRNFGRVCYHSAVFNTIWLYFPAEEKYNHHPFIKLGHKVTHFGLCTKYNLSRNLLVDVLVFFVLYIGKVATVLVYFHFEFGEHIESICFCRRKFSFPKIAYEIHKKNNISHARSNIFNFLKISLQDYLALAHPLKSSKRMRALYCSCEYLYRSDNMFVY